MPHVWERGRTLIEWGEIMSNHLDYEINKELGECYLFMSDYPKAEEYYRKAALNEPEAAAPYMGLATVAVQRGSLDDALVLYRKAASLEPSDKALTGIGLVLMEQGVHDEAFEQFVKALDMAPYNMVALNCLVRESYQLGRVDDVLPYLAAAAEGSTEKDAVSVTLAGCLIYLGRNAEAKTHLERVLCANPAHSGARELFDTVAA